jgi:hypothetical protein
MTPPLRIPEGTPPATVRKLIQRALRTQRAVYVIRTKKKAA